MSQCSKLDDYCDLRMKPNARIEFERHMTACSKCAKHVERWRRLGSEITAMGEAAIAAETPAGDDGAQGVVRATRDALCPGADVRRVRRLALWIAASFAVVAIAVAVAWTRPPKEEASLLAKSATRLVVTPASIAGGEAPRAAFEIGGGDVVSTAADERAFIDSGGDLLSVGARSRVRVVRTEAGKASRVRLLEGTLACVIEKREEDASFVVEAGELEVRVVGTRFSVTLGSGGEIDVAVGEGVVVVEGADGATPVVAGTSLRVGSNMERESEALDADALERMDALLSRGPAPDADGDDPGDMADATPIADSGAAAKEALALENAQKRGGVPSVPIATLQRWVLDGRVEEAEDELVRHLAAHPTDAKAWFLLADCHRRSGRYEDAASAYLNAEARCPRETASTAAYRAGVLLQEKLGRHGEAAAAFERFLSVKRDGHLAPEARLRLARSLLVLGREDRARELLEDLASRHAESAAGIEARRLLERP